ncbi:MAG TPA: efflux RND transporter permease subunit [Stellaceae bacterium]|jgi:multidrug efflux pump|nr:efflux RND transporter permease subunit [Stellaceae bacterium]
MARFFIDRPIFAWVIAIILMMAGAISIYVLPVAQYPTIAPPSIQVRAVYPGADAQTVENTVTQVIEQQMSGLDHLIYIASTSDNSGTALITLTFDTGTDADIAQVQTQNKLSLAIPLLPLQVQQQGIVVSKSTNNFLEVLAFSSSDGSMDKVDLTNYVASHIQDPLSRLNGVGTITLFGTQYAMRIWLNADKLNSYGLTPSDVTAALQAQNVQVPGGSLGGAPAVPNQQLSATITEATLLRTPDQFRQVLLKVLPDGSQVRIKDVARVELGSENYNFDTHYDNQPTAGLGIQLAPGANALQVAKLVSDKVDTLKPFFPHGMVVTYPYDTTPFVRISIHDVVITLLEGIVLVVLVMYLFLQNVRATFIPSIAVPVVLLGTFAIMEVLGFSINTLSMFGMVLAIGLLVDDAIVVVENVERVIVEEGLSPRDATRKAMSQITGALVGVAVVLSAVFIPSAMSSGAVGAIYRQFTLTIVSAMVLSVLVALILTPALCATILKPAMEHKEKGGFFGWFNRSFFSMRDRYLHGVQHIIKRLGWWMIVYVLIIAGVAFMFTRVPGSFLPQEDQGIMFIQVEMAPGTTLGRTQQVLNEVSTHMLQGEKAVVSSTFDIDGFSFSGRAQNAGIVFVRLKDWSQRTGPGDSVDALVGRTFAWAQANIKDATVFPINPPPILELGVAGGFDMELEDRAGLGHAALMAARGQLLGMASRDPTLVQVHPNGLNDTPTFNVNIDRQKASALGLNIGTIDQDYSIAWASAYVNNFLDTDNRIKRVFVQGDAPFRMNPSDVNRWYTRNNQGQMVPFSSFTTTKWTYGSPKLERYNGVSSIEIQGQPAPGKSTGDTINAMVQLSKKLPPGFGYEWTGMSYQELLSGAQAPLLYTISIIVVFLALAALYESWTIPISVIMVVPLGVLGALAATLGRGLSDDVYFQVGLLTTVGLSSKNAILIVEFARDMHREGRSLRDAAIEAARLRLRPIIMTSMAFMLGVLPLALSTGAGSGSQHAIGTGVIGGMLTATFLAPFLIPMFFVLVSEKLSFGRKKQAGPGGPSSGGPTGPVVTGGH